LSSFSGNYLGILCYASIAAMLALVSRLWHASAAGSIVKTRSIARRAVPLVFLVSSGGLLLFARRLILPYDQAFNPDEALLSAAAMLIDHGWLNWDIADTTSSGPLNAAILAWPYLFGGDITLFSGRLAGVACTFASVAFIFLALRRLSDDAVAIIATTPAFILFGATVSSDFVQYSSEQFPIFLLALAFWLFVRSFEADRLRYSVGAAFILGLVPFAKLHAAPTAAVIGGFVVARVLVDAWKVSPRSAMLRAAAVCAIALLPAVIVLVPLAASGDLAAFANGYLRERWLLIAGRPWDDPLPTLIDLAPFFGAEVIAYGAVLAVAIASLAGFARRIEVRSTLPSSLAWTSTLALALVLVSVTSVIAPGGAFPHYFLLAVPAIVIAVGAAFAAVAVLVDRRPVRHVAVVEGLAFAIMLAIILPAAHGEQKTAVWRIPAAEPFLHGRLFAAAHNLDWLRPREKDHMVCWAWASQCYVDAAILPATPDVTNEYQVYQTPLRPYFRARFLQDLARSRPDFIIDFSAPGYFAYGQPWFDQDIAHFPEFAEILRANFDLVSRVEPPERCPRLYLRKARLAELDRSLIKFASLAASASIPGHPATALDDRSISEICDDNWLLPTGTLGVAAIQFQQADHIRSVAMLSTRGGADRVRLSVQLMRKTVAASELTLARFPRWTWHRFDHAVAADGLTIEILSSHGPRAGLNEVKAYRD
jgi:hypothetical protein